MFAATMLERLAPPRGYLCTGGCDAIYATASETMQLFVTNICTDGLVPSAIYSSRIVAGVDKSSWWVVAMLEMKENKNEKFCLINCSRTRLKSVRHREMSLKAAMEYL